MEVMASCWRGQVSDSELRRIGIVLDANAPSCQRLQHLNALQGCLLFNEVTHGKMMLWGFFYFLSEDWIIHSMVLSRRNKPPN